MHAAGLLVLEGAPALMRQSKPMDSPDNHSARRAERMLFYGWAPLFVLALWPYTANPCEPPKLAVTAMLLLGCAVAGFFGMSVRRNAGLTAVLLAWLAWQTLCGLASPLPENSLWSLVPAAAWVLVAFAARRAFSDIRHAWRLVAVLVASLAAASVYGFAQRAGWDPFPWSSTDTVEYRGLPSSFGNPNFAGHALVPGIILALALSRQSRFCLPALAAALAMTVHLWFTGMRGGPVALAAAAVLYGAWRMAGWLVGPRRGRIALTLLLTVLAGLAGAAAALGAHRASHDTWLPVSDSSLVLRYNSAHGAARMVLSHPCTGVGPGNYERLNAAFWTPFEQRWFALRGLKNDHVHCEPLEAGAEAGVPGVFFHLLLFCWAVLGGLRLATDGDTGERRLLGLAVALCGFAMAVDGLFGFNLHVPVSAAIFFVLLGLLGGTMAQPGPFLMPHAVLSGFRTVSAMALSLAVAVGAAGHFFADRQALRSMGMTAELDRLAPGTAERAVFQNGLLQELARDRRVFPNDPRFSEAAGQVCLGAGYFEGAEKAFRATVAAYPDHPAALAGLAKALHGLAAGRASVDDWPGAAFLLRQAEAAAIRGVRLCPPLAAPHDALWRVSDLRAEAARRRNLDDTADEQRTALECRAALQAGTADRAPVFRTLARCALRAKNIQEAAVHAASAMQESPVSPDNWAVLESVAEACPDSPVLLDAVSRAYGLLKRASPPHPTLFRAAWWLTRMQTATPELAHAVVRDTLFLCPGEMGAWSVLTALSSQPNLLLDQICAERKRLFGDASDDSVTPEAVRDLCSEPPVSAAVLAAAAESVSRAAATVGGSNSPDRVRREYCWVLPLLRDAAVKAQAPPPELGRILTSAVTVYHAAQQWAEVDRTCADALPIVDADTAGMVNTARSNALAQMGRREEALAAARDAVRAAPQRMDAQWNLAQRLVESGLDREAMTVCQALLAQLPENAPARAALAAEYKRLRRGLSSGATGESP